MIYDDWHCFDCLSDDVRTIEDVTDLKMKSEEELLESNKDFGSSDKTNASFDNENGKKLNVAKEMESEDDAAQNLVDEGKDLRSDDLDALNINDGAVESNGGLFDCEYYKHEIIMKAHSFSSSGLVITA